MPRPAKPARQTSTDGDLAVRDGRAGARRIRLDGHGGNVGRVRDLARAAAGLACAARGGRQQLVAVAGTLREGGGATVDVLDADRLELVPAGLEAGAVVGGVDELVEERRSRLALDGPGTVVAARLELGAKVGVPDDRAHAVALVRAVEEVP